MLFTGWCGADPKCVIDITITPFSKYCPYTVPFNKYFSDTSPLQLASARREVYRVLRPCTSTSSPCPTPPTPSLAPLYILMNRRARYEIILHVMMYTTKHPPQYCVVYRM